MVGSLLGSLACEASCSDKDSRVSSCGVDLKSNQKIVGYFHDIHATITPVGVSSQIDHCSRLGVQSLIRWIIAFLLQ